MAVNYTILYIHTIVYNNIAVYQKRVEEICKMVLRATRTVSVDINNYGKDMSASRLTTAIFCITASLEISDMLSPSEISP